MPQRQIQEEAVAGDPSAVGESSSVVGGSDAAALGRALTGHGPRFWVDDLAGSQGHDVFLEEEEARHARRVLRLVTGDLVVLLDGRGAWARAVVGGEQGRRLACRVLAVTQLPPRQPELVVAAAMPKGQHADEMLAQLAQLGAHRFIPLQTERSVVHPRETKFERYRKMTRVAAKQSGSPWVMAIDPQQSLASVLAMSGGPWLLLDPGGERLPEVGVRLAGVPRITLLVGPEGGWSDTEQALLLQAGALPWSIGPQVLRIETAAAAALAILVWALAE